MVYAHATVEIVWGPFLSFGGFGGSRVTFYDGRIHWPSKTRIELGVLILYIKIGTLRSLSGNDGINHGIACLLPGITLLIFVGHDAGIWIQSLTSGGQCYVDNNQWRPWPV